MTDSYLPMILCIQIIIAFIVCIFSLASFLLLIRIKSNIYMQIYSVLAFILSVCWGILIYIVHNSAWYLPNKIADILITFVIVGTLSTILYSIIVIFCYAIKKGLFK